MNAFIVLISYVLFQSETEWGLERARLSVESTNSVAVCLDRYTGYIVSNMSPWHLRTFSRMTATCDFNRTLLLPFACWLIQTFQLGNITYLIHKLSAFDDVSLQAVVMEFHGPECPGLNPSPFCTCGQENQTTEHMLQRYVPKLWQPDANGDSTTMQTKLYGCREELEKTAQFTSLTGLTV